MKNESIEKRMQHLHQICQFILELNKLKLIFRNTKTNLERNESTAEHSWSASMIVTILIGELKKEFAHIDELKSIKLALIHDVVEIYAGDVSIFDIEARKNQTKNEIDALKKLMDIYPDFGQQLHELWHEFEQSQTIEAKIAKAADAICPIFQRLQAKQSYIPAQLKTIDLERIKYPYFAFSKTFIALYQQLVTELLEAKLIQNK